MAAGLVQVKDMGSGEQLPASRAEVVAMVRARLAGGGLKG
jgi:hypothetical protein